MSHVTKWALALAAHQQGIALNYADNTVSACGLTLTAADMAVAVHGHNVDTTFPTCPTCCVLLDELRETMLNAPHPSQHPPAEDHTEPMPPAPKP